MKKCHSASSSGKKNWVKYSIAATAFLVGSIVSFKPPEAESTATSCGLVFIDQKQRIADICI
jgi:hypothetical protein